MKVPNWITNAIDSGAGSFFFSALVLIVLAFMFFSFVWSIIFMSVGQNGISY